MAEQWSVQERTNEEQSHSPAQDKATLRTLLNRTRRNLQTLQFTFDSVGLKEHMPFSSKTLRGHIFLLQDPTDLEDFDPGSCCRAAPALLKVWSDSLQLAVN